MKRGEGERQRTEGVGGCGAKRKGKKKMSVQTKGRTKRLKVWKEDRTMEQSMSIRTGNG